MRIGFGIFFFLILSMSLLVRADVTERPNLANSPQTTELVELGRLLFFDPRLSSTKTISCNSCHNILTGSGLRDSGTDNQNHSTGIFGARGDRNAPTVWNVSLRKVFFWDGRAKSLEEQAKGPILNPVEMGMMNAAQVEKTIQEIPEYPEKFRMAFSPLNGKKPYRVSMEEIAIAIAAFERTLTTPNSPFDRFREGDLTAISPAAQRGWTKFKAHACTACHASPTFSNRDHFIRFPVHKNKDYENIYKFSVDLGRYNVTKEFKDRNLWRVPSLKNVAITEPYFHNGSVESLEDAVRIMAKVQLDKELAEEDIKDIVEFLKSLTGQRSLPKK